MPQHIDNFMQGYNICYMAYGQTGSGKTHTITGPPKSFKIDPPSEDEIPEHYGLFPRTAIDIWKKIQGHDDMKLTIAIFEDYCFEVKDMSTGKICKVDIVTLEPDDYVEHKLETFQDIIKMARIVET
jgi:kinesin family member 25